MIHAAKIIDKGDTFWFASLDGENWVGVNQDPRNAESDAVIQRIFDGDGKWRPISATRLYLFKWGAKFFDR